MAESDLDAELQRVTDELSQSLAALSPAERMWRDKGLLLEARGYRLRPRYQQDWVPSWLGNDVDFEECEDSRSLPRPQVIDAVRIRDGALVSIKRARTGSEDITLAQHLYSSSLKDDPRNHCVPVLDTIVDEEEPDTTYLVMPFLRLMDSPPFETVDEVVDFIDQILEGLVFLHEQGVAHRDCSLKNIMMDASNLYPEGFHPVALHFTPDVSRIAPQLPRRTARVKYYFIDFGISVHIPEGAPNRLVTGRLGRDRDPPELHSDELYDPFKLDVFIIGNTLRKEFHKKYANVDFLRPLIRSMLSLEPESRPSAVEALKYWKIIKTTITRLQMVDSLRGRQDSWVRSVLLDMLAFVRLGVWLSSEVLDRVAGVFGVRHGDAPSSDMH
ncbi:hypothetical protein PHLGIDRAFT_127369 [Phlebiopsis gigantea 11061_1 CR5-6]|uniref:Protein kinase domain-containing protein n=1 Tax=Phlebiopsis gigantea (strain 11061_1 CR5-6) TaxID=745531 RepID=A0A0C3NRY7_PHLG1|nr:hypothetical protein PHLGIDRAFT_127369 [Phlebiopsis gigantea 11061_1 CR5-6]